MSEKTGATKLFVQFDNGGLGMIGMLAESFINSLLGTLGVVLCAIFGLVLCVAVLFGTGIVKFDKTIAEYFDDGWDGSESDKKFIPTTGRSD